MRFYTKLVALAGRFPWLCLGFVLMLALTVVFSVRLFDAADRWRAPVLPDEPLAGWMTPRYAARCMHVPPEVVIAILNLTPEHHQRRATLSMIAAERGMDLADFLRDLEAAVAADREAHGPPPAQHRPPPPPRPAPAGRIAMTDQFFTLVSTYGLVVVGICAYVSCLAVPVPTFAVMLAGGALAASGDFVLWQVWGVAYGAAVSGDQTGFQIGRTGGARVLGLIGRRGRWQDRIARAQAYLLRWGGIGVFFSTWLVAPLGPWVNLIAGAAGLHPLRFLVWDAAGEAIWVTTYIMLGYTFGDQLSLLVDVVSNYAGAVTAAVLSVGFATLLVRRFRRIKDRGRDQA